MVPLVTNLRTSTLRCWPWRGRVRACEAAAVSGVSAATVHELRAGQPVSPPPPLCRGSWSWTKVPRRGRETAWQCPDRQGPAWSGNSRRAHSSIAAAIPSLANALRTALDRPHLFSSWVCFEFGVTSGEAIG